MFYRVRYRNDRILPNMIIRRILLSIMMNHDNGIIWPRQQKVDTGITYWRLPQITANGQ